MSLPPSLKDLEKGWQTEDAKNIQETFQRHGRLLLLLVKLEVIPKKYYRILCSDFQMQTFDKIRDGDDI